MRQDMKDMYITTDREDALGHLSSFLTAEGGRFREHAVVGCSSALGDGRTEEEAVLQHLERGFVDVPNEQPLA